MEPYVVACHANHVESWNGKYKTNDDIHIYFTISLAAILKNSSDVIYDSHDI